MQDKEFEKGSSKKDNEKGREITLKGVTQFGLCWEATEGKGVEYYTFSNENTEESEKAKNHAGTFSANGKTYVGISKDGDCNFTDAMFMFTTALATTTETVAPDPEPTHDPTPDPTPDPDPTPKPDPADPIVTAGGGSVEVNLAMNAEKETGDWKDSHLSIHVRDTTDIALYIPVNAEYYCPQDDMAIVQKHDVAYQYNTTNETMSMNINGNDVSLNVAFTDDGITITSNGINADVLKYLRTTYGDGLTFEVRNYYNDGLDRTALQALLSQSTIAFTNATKTYVNAFGIYKDVIDPLACTVKPEDGANRTTPPTGGIKSDKEHSQLYIYPLK